MNQTKLIAIGSSFCMILALLIFIAVARNPTLSGVQVNVLSNSKRSSTKVTATKRRNASHTVEAVVRVAHANSNKPALKRSRNLPMTSYSPSAASLKADDTRLIRIDGHLASDSDSETILASLLLPDLNVNSQAIAAIQKSTDPEIGSKLLALISNGTDPVELAAIEALGAIQFANATSPLSELLNSPNPAARRASAKALAQLDSPAAQKALLQQLESGPAEDRLQLVQSLQGFKDQKCRHALVSVLQSENSKLRIAAINALAAQGDTAICPRIEQSLRDEDKFVRRSAVKALQSFASNDSLSALLDSCRNDKDRRVRQLAATAIGELAGPAYIGLLQNELKGQDTSVEATILEAINSIRARN